MKLQYKSRLVRGGFYIISAKIKPPTRGGFLLVVKVLHHEQNQHLGDFLALRVFLREEV